jgi:hypothetical protein
MGQEDTALVFGERGAREVAVGLACDQAFQFVALVCAGGLPQPVFGVADDQGVRFGDPARVLDAEEFLLRAVDVAPEGGFSGTAAFSAAEEAVGDA